MSRASSPDAKASAGKGPGAAGTTLSAGDGVLYIVPQRIHDTAKAGKTTVYFRSRDAVEKSKFLIKDSTGTVVFEKIYPFLRPPEMERLELDFSGLGLSAGTALTAVIEEVSG